MDGLALVRGLQKHQPMPMARHFTFSVVEVDRGNVVATAIPTSEHYNPFNVAQGGFAATVLDIVLGLVSITVLEAGDSSIATTDLSVRYIRGITQAVGVMTVRGSIVHAGKRTVVAEARLFDAAGSLYATAQSTSLIVSEPPSRA